jgi:hypothetical protein
LIKHERNNIRTHLQSFLADIFGIVVNGAIFPTIAQIAFEAVKTNQPTFVYQSKTLRRFAFVFVYLWQSFRKTVFL